MPKPIALTALLLYLSLCAQALCVDKIEGAFGKKLGDMFAFAESTGQSALTDGTPMYQFIPEKPFRSFARYYVLITPTTHRIYSIWAIGDVPNTETGKKEQALIMELLQQKYGEISKAELFDSFRDSIRISQGERTILTKLTGFTDVTLEIRYTDYDLQKVAEKERLAIEAKKVDASGL